MAGPKILGQHAGNGATALLYTATSFGAAISSIVVSNVDTVARSVRLRSVPTAGTAEAVVHTVLPTTSVAAGELLVLQIGIALQGGAVLRVLADTGLVVHVYGTEL